MLKARTELQVPFHDIDVLRIAWHGHYLKYFELARTVLMQKVGLDWPDLAAHGIAMPIVEAHVQYRRPLAYAQDAVVDACIEEFAFAELRVHYEIRAKGDEAKVLASGWTRQVYISMAEQTTFFAVPEMVLERLLAAEEQGV